MQEQLYILQEKEQLIPGSVQYNIRRFKKHPQINIDDTGMMVYHFKKPILTKIIWSLDFVSQEIFIARKKILNVIFASIMIQEDA